MSCLVVAKCLQFTMIGGEGGGAAQFQVENCGSLLAAGIAWFHQLGWWCELTTVNSKEFHFGYSPFVRASWLCLLELIFFTLKSWKFYPLKWMK